MDISFGGLFSVRKPIIGMIHCAGSDDEDIVRRALLELKIYERAEVDGAIVEDYHGSAQNVKDILRELRHIGLPVGVNILRNATHAFDLARNYGAKFVQLDTVQTPDLDLEAYASLRRRFPKIAVLGGVGFKYTQPTGNPLEQDLREAMGRCEAIVTTGSGAGLETPIDKLREFKRHLVKFPLITGAGVNARNAYEQMLVADGAIIGSGFKPVTDDYPNGNTRLLVDPDLVAPIVREIKRARAYVGKD